MQAAADHAGEANAADSAAAAAELCVRPVTILVSDGDELAGGTTVNMAVNQSLEDALVQEMETGSQWTQKRLRHLRAGRPLQPMCPTPLWCDRPRVVVFRVVPSERVS